MIFKSEKEAKEFLRGRMPVAIRPARKSKYQLVYPFRSCDAQEQVVNCLAKALIEKQEKPS